MSITIYGDSDDLIEVDGDIREEFSYSGSEEGDLLGFSDGTLLRIRHDDQGTWRITPVCRGASNPGIEIALEGERTDRATVDAVWVVHGTGMAKR